MKRRSILSLSALSTVPVAARAADEESNADVWGTINDDALEFTTVTDDGKISLQVERFNPPEEEVTQAMDEKGEHRCYQYKGKDMPGRFWPGQSLLTRFDLTRDGKRIPIAERFWNDFTRARPSRPRRFRQPARHNAAPSGHFFLSSPNFHSRISNIPSLSLFPTAHRSLLTRHFFPSSASPAPSSATARLMSAKTRSLSIDTQGLPPLNKQSDR